MAVYTTQNISNQYNLYIMHTEFKFIDNVQNCIEI